MNKHRFPLTRRRFMCAAATTLAMLLAGCAPRQMSASTPTSASVTATVPLPLSTTPPATPAASATATVVIASATPTRLTDDPAQTGAIVEAVVAQMRSEGTANVRAQVEKRDGPFAHVRVALPPPSVLPQTAFVQQQEVAWIVILKAHEHALKRADVLRLDIPATLWSEDDFSAVTG